jgi:prevent-host-death family protein
MTSVGIFEAKNRLSELCEQVAASGEPLLIRRRGAPLVRIVPIAAEAREACVWDSVQDSAAKNGALKDDWSGPERCHDDWRESPL